MSWVIYIICVAITYIACRAIIKLYDKNKKEEHWEWITFSLAIISSLIAPIFSIFLVLVIYWPFKKPGSIKFPKWL